MKIVVIEGEDTHTSRKRFSQIVAGVKAKGWQVLFAEESNLPNLLQSPQSLFGQETLYVLEKPQKLSKKTLTPDKLAFTFYKT